MTLRATALLAAAFLTFAVPATSNAALSTYTQNFESLVQSSPTALSGDGWLVYGNVFSPDHSTWYYGYGPFPAPNGTGAFCNVDLLPGTPPQGLQDMVVFSDYNNGDHANGNLVESIVYREWPVAAADVGATWVFQFDAKLGNLVAPTTANAFIKTLNPSAGYAMTNYLTYDTTAIPSTWGTYSISITIDASLVGQVLQIGFSNTATHYNGSGVFYDNINFSKSQATPTRTESWGKVKASYR